MKKKLFYASLLIIFAFIFIFTSSININGSKNIVVKNTEAIADIKPIIGCTLACVDRIDTICFLCEDPYCWVSDRGWANCALTGYCTLNM